MCVTEDFAAQEEIIKHDRNFFMYIIGMKKDSRIIFDNSFCHVLCLLQDQGNEKNWRECRVKF